jgi:hypothetical protein
VLAPLARLKEPAAFVLAYPRLSLLLPPDAPSALQVRSATLQRRGTPTSRGS